MVRTPDQTALESNRTSAPSAPVPRSPPVGRGTGSHVWGRIHPGDREIAITGPFAGIHRPVRGREAVAGRAAGRVDGWVTLRQIPGRGRTLFREAHRGDLAAWAGVCGLEVSADMRSG